jgi:hypothetical protein
MYQILPDGVIQRLSDGASFLPGSTSDLADEYRAWLDAGNVPVTVTWSEAAANLSPPE